MKIRSAYRKESTLGSGQGPKGGKEQRGSKPFIHTTPGLTSILTAEGAVIIRTFYRDGPTCIILLFAAIDPPSIGILCAGIGWRTEPPAVVRRTLKIRQTRGEGKVDKSSRHLGVVRIRIRMGSLCLMGVWFAYVLKFEQALGSRQLEDDDDTNKMPGS